MLVTNPNQRATLPEILAHPWMVKGYDGPPNAHLPTRQPLRPGQLNPEVIKGMTGFEFGTPEEIEARLTEVLTSESYMTVLHGWESKHGMPLSGLSPAASFAGAGSNGTLLGSEGTLGRAHTRGSVESKSKTGSKRFSGIDFYRKKISVFGGGSKDDGSGTSNGVLSGSTNPNATWPGAGKEPLDPTRGFHPLISIYYLVSEKMERERLYGHSFFASSNISVNGPLPAGPSGRPAVSSAAGDASGGSMPTAADIPQEALRVPEASHISAGQKDSPILPADLPAPPRSAASSTPASPTPVFESRQKSQPMAVMAGAPRARAQGDEVEAALRDKGFSAPMAAAGGWTMSSRRSDAAASALSPPPRSSISGAVAAAPVQPLPSNHKRSLSLTGKRPASAGMGVPPPPLDKDLPAAVPRPARKDGQSASPDDRRSYHAGVSPMRDGSTPLGDEDAGAATPGGGSSFVRRFGSLIGRSPSSPLDAERRRQARMSTGGMPTAAPTPVRRGSTHITGLMGVAESGAEAPASPEPADSPVAARSDTGVRRSGTLNELGRPRPSTASPGAVSMGRAAGGRALSPSRVRPGSLAAPLGTVDASVDDPAPASAVSAGGWHGVQPGQLGAMPPNARRDGVARSATVNAGSSLYSSAGAGAAAATPSREGEAATSKPIFLKGLFSVQTTSTKSRTVIHADLVRVLERIGVQYREIRSGYECVHLPSLDFSGAGGAPTQLPEGQGNARIPMTPSNGGAGISSGGGIENMDGDAGTRPQGPRRKQSRISFVSSRRERRRAENASQADTASISSATAYGTDERRSPVNSRSRASSLAGSGSSPALDQQEGTPSKAPRAPSRQRTDSIVEIAPGSAPPPVPAKTIDQTTAHDLAVRFEIFVVKVPLLLGVNGLQFRRVSGNPWQYSMLARRVLQELKL
jgi:hypothetical protein